MAIGAGPDGFRRYLRSFRETHPDRNIIAAFLTWQRMLHEERTHRWFALRWGVPHANVAAWAIGRRRPKPTEGKLFDDLFTLAGVTMDEFYSVTPVSNQTGTAGWAEEPIKVARARKRRG